MYKIIILMLLAPSFYACNDAPKVDSDAQVNELAIEVEDSKYNMLNLNFNKPTVIDSSDWVSYHLPFAEYKETDNGFSSKKYGRQTAYWNVVFYNTETKVSRLLSDSLKMLIHTISYQNTTIHSGEQNLKAKKTIYYTVTTTDFNNDLKLDTEDPNYLFVSDLSGKNFIQISPLNYDLVNWNLINRTNKVLIQARSDSNNDKKFNNNDELSSFIYDIDNQHLEPVFSDDFILKTKKLLLKNWTVDD